MWRLGLLSAESVAQFSAGMGPESSTENIEHWIPDLSNDFKYRLLVMFSTVAAAAMALFSLYRLALAVKRIQDEWSASGDHSLQLAVGARSLEVLQAAIVLTADGLYIMLTYTRFGTRAVSVAASFLTILTIYLQPIACQAVTATLLLRWFPQPTRRARAMVATLAGLNLIPFLLSITSLATKRFLEVQWLAFTIVCAGSILSLIVMRFHLFWMTSKFPTMAYNEVNSKVIQGKIVILYLSGIIDCAVILICMDQPFILNLIIDFLLTPASAG
ncbi:hypothetical protein H9P43_005992 [Blastocladiella emersonii ATCC 22665]|nr:hypothetical protein H9P43_005992 [Blastocladiella emersonii ATCC 22665]